MCGKSGILIRFFSNYVVFNNLRGGFTYGSIQYKSYDPMRYSEGLGNHISG